MKRILILVGIGGLLLVAGFFGGWGVQYLRSGYHYRLLERKEYASALGPIEWTCFLESVGMPFLDTEKTMITMGDRTIYKAQRIFQAKEPRARNIETSGNSITWEDGDFRYRLMVEPTTNTGAAPLRQPPMPQETKSTSTPTGAGR